MTPRSPIRFAAACALAFACQAVADMDVPTSTVPNPDAEVAVAAVKAGAQTAFYRDLAELTERFIRMEAALPAPH